MDKLIRDIEKDIAAGKLKDAQKKLNMLEVQDKRRDHIMKKYHQEHAHHKPHKKHELEVEKKVKKPKEQVAGELEEHKKKLQHKGNKK